MRFTEQIVLASALLSAATSAIPLKKRGGFSIKQTPSGLRKKGGAQSLAHAHRRFSSHVPDHVAAAANSSNYGSVEADPSAYDEAYYCEVTIGDQTMHLDFDTGSSDL